MKTNSLFTAVISLILLTNTLSAQNPVAKFGINGYGIKNKNVCFLDSSTIFSDIVERTWNYGDSPTNYTIVPTTTVTSHVYSAPGTYTVKLVVKNMAGFKDSVVHSILIKDVKMPKLHIYQDAVFPQMTAHPNHIEFGQGPFFYNKITHCEDTSAYSSSYASLAYKKWKFYDPSSAPADTSLLQYASNTYTTNPTTIRIVYYYTFLNPAGVCGSGSGGGGFALDSIVSMGGSGGCPNTFQDQNGLFSNTQLMSDSLTPQNNLSYTICPTNQLVINQSPCFNCWQSNFVVGQLTSLYSSSSFTNQSSISNYTQSFNPSLPTYTMNFANPGYYTYWFNGQGGFGEPCNSLSYNITVKACSSTGVNDIHSDMAIASYYNVYNSSIQVNCLNNATQLQKVELYDMVGKLLVEKNNINGQLLEISTSQFSGTLFILKATTNKGIFINKILLQ